jgi:hypothetical protein
MGSCALTLKLNGMSIDKVRLSPAVIGALYKNIWTAGPDAFKGDVHLAPADETAVRYLGNHARKVTLLVNNPGHTFVSEEDLAFLVRIFGACKMTLDDIAIVNQAPQSCTVADLQRELTPRVLLLFGLEATDIRLPFQVPHFKIQDYNGCQYLCLPPLSQLNQETGEARLLKSKLWLCLKELFGI